MIITLPDSLQSAQEKPNIVYIMVDDMGYGANAGCYNPKSKIPTPNIDSLFYFIKTTILLSFSLIITLPDSLQASQEKPNIVYIMVDDMGYGDPGCYNPKSKIPTPHIDSCP